MAWKPITLAPLDSLVAAALRGELDERQARQLYARGAEAVTFILTAMARRLAEQRCRDGHVQRLVGVRHPCHERGIYHYTKEGANLPSLTIATIAGS